MLWPELARQYPSAKIVLSTRPPDAWFKSISNIIFPTLLTKSGPDEPATTSHRRITYSLIVERIFEARIDDRQIGLDVYQRNTGRVLRGTPSSRLLQYQPGEGWEPLCDYFGVDVPDEPYLRSNNTAEFRQWAGLDYKSEIQPTTS